MNQILYVWSLAGFNLPSPADHEEFAVLAQLICEFGCKDFGKHIKKNKR
jgi:hypothetical protein